MVEMLLSAGANPDLSDDDEVSPLLCAAFSGRCDIARLLIDAGCHVNVTTLHGYTALHHAAWESRVSVVQLLINSGAVVDGRTEDGNTPLALAVHGQCNEALQLFVQHGCDVNNSDKDRDTPLLYAVHNGDVDAVKFLLDHGADSLVRNRADVSVIWQAAYYGQRDVLLYLVVHSNPPLSVPSRGLVYDYEGSVAPYIYSEPRTPLYAALDRGHFTVVSALLEAGVEMLHESWYWSTDSDITQRDDVCQQKDLVCRLHCAATTVPPLLYVTRNMLRRHLAHRITTVVPTLDIPHTLKDILLLRDVYTAL